MKVNHGPKNLFVSQLLLNIPIILWNMIFIIYNLTLGFHHLNGDCCDFKGTSHTTAPNDRGWSTRRPRNHRYPNWRARRAQACWNQPTSCPTNPDSSTRFHISSLSSTKSKACLLSSTNSICSCISRISICTTRYWRRIASKSWAFKVSYYVLDID